MKYLKPPLGENEAVKRERVKELIESDKNKVSEEERKTSSLARWEESLMKCSSFSQIFVHLNTLDRSVIWDKSVQNVKCRKCKRKGTILFNLKFGSMGYLLYHLKIRDENLQ